MFTYAAMWIKSEANEISSFVTSSQTDTYGDAGCPKSCTGLTECGHCCDSKPKNDGAYYIPTCNEQHLCECAKFIPPAPPIAN